MKIIITIAILLGVAILFGLFYDRYLQRRNLVKANFPLVGRFRYLFHELRPFFRQYFGDDDAWSPRIIIDWILNVSEGRTGYFSFDKFDTTEHLHDGKGQMIHSSNPLNNEEMKPEYPLIGKKRNHPLQMNGYFYRSAMSFGSIGPEATQAMSKACLDAGAAFNTGEGSIAIHHLPGVKFSKTKKWLKFKKVPSSFKAIYKLLPGNRLKNDFVDLLGQLYLAKGMRDLFLFDDHKFVFYGINWNASLEDFPKPGEKDESFGNIIFQIGSGMYGLRKKTADGSFEFDFDRFAKASRLVSAIEIKLAQGAKQSGGILKAAKNTPALAEIRGVHPGIDLVSPNRFPFYDKGKEKEFFEFMQKLSDLAGGKPVGCKIVISNESSIEPLAKAIKAHPEIAPDFITVDGGDGGSATAPIALGVLFGKKIYEAIELVDQVLKKHEVRDKLKLFASSKLYAPHMSARAMALGADAVGNARSIMIAGGCIRAGVCSGEKATCPVGMATMNKSKRKAYAQAMEEKSRQIANYIKAHNKGLIQVAAICGVKSPSLLNKDHLVK